MKEQMKVKTQNQQVQELLKKQRQAMEPTQKLVMKMLSNMRNRLSPSDDKRSL